MAGNATTWLLRSVLICYHWMANIRYFQVIIFWLEMVRLTHISMSFAVLVLNGFYSFTLRIIHEKRANSSVKHAVLRPCVTFLYYLLLPFPFIIGKLRVWSVFFGFVVVLASSFFVLFIWALYRKSVWPDFCIIDFLHCCLSWHVPLLWSVNIGPWKDLTVPPCIS